MEAEVYIPKRMSEALSLCSFPVPSATVHWEITKDIKLGNGELEFVQNKEKWLKNGFSVAESTRRGWGECGGCRG